MSKYRELISGGDPDYFSEANRRHQNPLLVHTDVVFGDDGLHVPDESGELRLAAPLETNQDGLPVVRAEDVPLPQAALFAAHRAQVIGAPVVLEAAGWSHTIDPTDAAENYHKWGPRGEGWYEIGTQQFRHVTIQGADIVPPEDCDTENSQYYDRLGQQNAAAYNALEAVDYLSFLLTMIGSKD